MKARRSYWLFLIAIAATACDAPESITSESPIAPQFITWSCYDPTDNHCSDTPPPGDPDSTAPGIFLGDFDPDFCFGSGTDEDNDGMVDFCEYQLALSFRPLLSTSPYDSDLSRESYWAVNVDVEGAVKIIYMFGYHTDYGNTFSTYCQSDPFNLCGGHFGDSEFVQVTLDYDYTSEHWVLQSMYTAAHYNTGGDSSELTWSSSVDYPSASKAGWYPRVFVARDKHGSFPSRSSCNSGGFYSDDCTDNSDDTRFLVSSYRNVGGSGTGNSMVSEPVQSIDNQLVYGGEEYFWSNYAFCGWDTASSTYRQNCSTPYRTILLARGF